jgi:hypothetical protein
LDGLFAHADCLEVHRTPVAVLPRVVIAEKAIGLADGALEAVKIGRVCRLAAIFE